MSENDFEVRATGQKVRHRTVVRIEDFADREAVVGRVVRAVEVNLLRHASEVQFDLFHFLGVEESLRVAEVDDTARFFRVVRGCQR